MDKSIMVLLKVFINKLNILLGEGGGDGVPEKKNNLVNM